MIDGDQIVALIGVAAALTLALRSYRSKGVPLNRSVTMALIWVMVIVVLALIFAQLGAKAL